MAYTTLKNGDLGMVYDGFTPMETPICIHMWALQIPTLLGQRSDQQLHQVAQSS